MFVYCFILSTFSPHPHIKTPNLFNIIFLQRVPSLHGGPEPLRDFGQFLQEKVEDRSGHGLLEYLKIKIALNSHTYC